MGNKPLISEPSVIGWWWKMTRMNPLMMGGLHGISSLHFRPQVPYGAWTSPKIAAYPSVSQDSCRHLSSCIPDSASLIEKMSSWHFHHYSSTHFLIYSSFQIAVENQKVLGHLTTTFCNNQFQWRAIFLVLKDSSRLWEHRFETAYLRKTLGSLGWHGGSWPDVKKANMLKGLNRYRIPEVRCVSKKFRGDLSSKGTWHHHRRISPICKRPHQRLEKALWNQRQPC